MIARGEFDRASVEIQGLLGVDPLNAEAWCLKAENDLQRSRFVSAIHNAERALELAPDDPENQVRASVSLFSAYFMLGETEHALDAIRRAAEFVPDSLPARLFHADALAVAGRFAEARREYRSIQRAFPYSPEPLIKFGVFEISEGNVMSGKQLISRAAKLNSTGADGSTTDAALSLAEAGVAILDSPEDHLQKAESLANKVLANKASSPVSRLLALNAKAIAALAKENIPGAEAIAEEVMKITPANPTILISIAQWAHYNNRPELALRYLSRAERIAPNMPLVKAVGQKIRGE
jgi:tetratricopeptide (TPR) repeat protein